MTLSKNNRPALIALSALALWPLAGLAHDGHGMAGSHWHATDTWGFVVLAVGLALVVWLSSRNK